jgi:anti-anti-sigma factor
MRPSDGTFRLEEFFERDGALRLALTGELDVAVVEHLSSRLRELRREGYAVRLDLSSLEFVDSSGLRVLVRAVTDSRRHGWQLDVAVPVAEQVARAIDLIGARSLFWPDDG